MIGIVVGTRPELIKIYPMVNILKKKKMSFKIIHTGQHYSGNLNDIFIRDFKILKPDYNLKVGSKPHSEQISNMMVGIEKLFLKHMFKAMIVYGDTNSALAGALVASKFNKTKVIHLEAGLRSFDKNMPEELNRRIIDHCSDILLCPTQISKNNLLNENISTKKIFVVGNTIYDAIKSKIVRKKIASIKKTKKNYILITIHREENTINEKNLKKILKSLEKLCKKLKYQVIFPTHPKTQKIIKKINYDKKLINSIKPLNYFNFLSLLKNCKLILSDSGGIQEEACILKVPLITIRNSTERPETINIGCNILSKIDNNMIYEDSMKILNRKIKWRNPYGDGKASLKSYYIIKKQLKKNEHKYY